MRTELDPADRALHTLRGRRWSGASFDLELENRLMAAYDAHTPATRLGRYRVVVPILGILVIAGVAFAAVGGVALIKSWLVTTKINGQVVDTREVVPNDDGTAKYSVPISPPGNGPQTVEMTVAGDDSGGTKTVTVTSDGNTADVEIKPQE
jgi:hypothetical protein